MSLPSPTHSGGCRRWLKTSWKPFASAFRHSNQRLPSHGPPTMWACSLRHGENFMSVERKMSREEVRRRIGLVRADNQRSGKTWRDGLITARELQTKQFKPVRIILPKLIPEGVTILAGKPKIGKSWFMLDVCVAVAGDRFVLGDKKPMPGDVLYLALEDNQRRLKKRMDKLMGDYS